MLVAFLESVKYVGHLIPIAFLRIFLGYFYFHQAFLKLNSDYLSRPRLASDVAEVLPYLNLSIWYKSFMSLLFVHYWQPTAFFLLGLEFAIGISYLLGYVVRPVALLAALVVLNLLFLSRPDGQDFYRLVLAAHVTMAWVGAGRCLGVDYYFFKRRRGFWW